MQTSPSPASVYQAIASVAQTRPDDVALLFDGQDVTYEKFIIHIQRTAGHLKEMGIAYGDRFGVLAPNCPDILYAYYAASMLGAVIVPLNAALSAEEATYIVQHSGLRLLFVANKLSDIGLRAAGKAMRPLARLRDPAKPLTEPAKLTTPDADFLLIYTSGSTGIPKAVMLSQAAQIAAPVALRDMWCIGPEDKVLVALPLGFLYGLSTACAVALQAGAQVVLLDRFHPARVLEAMAAGRIDYFQGVPTMYSMMLEYCEARDLSFDLSGLTALVSAGAPLPDETVARFRARFSKRIDNYYAMTEVTPVFGRYHADATLPEGAIGKAAPGADIRIEAADGTACAPGEIGEILVRGAATMTRYDGDPDLTAQSMERGFFRSGDLGYRDAEGHYFITGRSKDIIIRGGANIAPAEVEGVLARHPAVQDVAVIGQPDRILGEVPVAFIVLRPAQGTDAATLEAHAERHLADFKVPRHYRFCASLPQGKTGKIEKAALRALLQQPETEAPK